jgi:predicted molibdopterin-dependent oxidoreductase YjgC
MGNNQNPANPLRADREPKIGSVVRLPAGQREPVQIWINGQETQAFSGEMVSTALLARGPRQFRRTVKNCAPRGLYCGMGVCFDCLVTIDGIPNLQACLTPVAAGMRIETE